MALARAEPPVGGGSGYSYSRPSGGFGGGFSGGFGGGHGGGGGGGGALVPVAPGPSSNEGQYVDNQILEEVRKIILKDEASQPSYSSGGGGGGYPSGPSSSYGAPSSSYGVPSSSYGVPSQQYISRVVGVDLEGVKQALQVAQYLQTSGGGGGGYSYSAPSSSYSAPSSSYGAPSRPSGSYGAPF